MLVSVSGWSGPSFAFCKARVSSRSFSASLSLSGVEVAIGEVGHAQQRLGVVAAELGGERRPGFLEEVVRFLRITQAKLRKAERHLHSGHGEWVARGLPLDLRRRPVQTLSQHGRQRLAVLRRVCWVQVVEDRAQNLVHLRHLSEPLFGLLTLLGFGLPRLFLGRGFGHGELLLLSSIRALPARLQ